MTALAWNNGGGVALYDAPFAVWLSASRRWSGSAGLSLNLILHLFFLRQSHRIRHRHSNAPDRGLMYAFARTINIGRLPVSSRMDMGLAGPSQRTSFSGAQRLTWWPLLFLCAERMSSKFGCRLVAASACNGMHAWRFSANGPVWDIRASGYVYSGP